MLHCHTGKGEQRGRYLPGERAAAGAGFGQPRGSDHIMGRRQRNSAAEHRCVPSSAHLQAGPHAQR